VHKCILIVDHNAPIRVLMKAVIEARTDFEVWEATDGQEGIVKSLELQPESNNKFLALHGESSAMDN
jgi:chemotaxis response regulator CheB